MRDDVRQALANGRSLDLALLGRSTSRPKADVLGSSEGSKSSSTGSKTRSISVGFPPRVFEIGWPTSRPNPISLSISSTESSPIWPPWLRS